MDFHPPCFQIFLRLPPPSSGLLAILREDQEIIHVADVAFHSQLLFYEMIEAIEMDVREELAGQIPDGQAVPPDVAVEQIVSPFHAMTIFVGFQDPLDQRHHLPVCNRLADALQ